MSLEALFLGLHVMGESTVGVTRVPSGALRRWVSPLAKESESSCSLRKEHGGVHIVKTLFVHGVFGMHIMGTPTIESALEDPIHGRQRARRVLG